MQTQWALVTDFDGTISADDFFTLAAQKYFDEQMLAPWRAYQKGEKKHFDALNEMFQKLRRLPDLDNFIKSIPLDKNFEKVAALCLDKNILVCICSAGCDYYINLLLGDIIEKYDINLITNHGEYSYSNGLKMTKLPKNHPCYDDAVGISKKLVVKNLQKRGKSVIFAGDGKPDIAAASCADVVFAKKQLLSMCQEDGIQTQPFNSFADIYNFIKEL